MSLSRQGNMYSLGQLSSRHWPSFSKEENKGSVLLWYSCFAHSINLCFWCMKDYNVVSVYWNIVWWGCETISISWLLFSPLPKLGQLSGCEVSWPRECVLGVHLSSDLSLDKHIYSVSATCFHRLCQLRRIRRLLGGELVVKLAQAFVTSPVDYCNAVLVAAPKTTTDTDRLQRVLIAATQVISDTRKCDHRLSRVMHQELHWLDIPERVNYKLDILTHRYLLGKASVYLSNCCIPVVKVAT